MLQDMPKQKISSGTRDELNALHHICERKGGTKVELVTLLSNEEDEFKGNALFIVAIGLKATLHY